MSISRRDLGRVLVVVAVGALALVTLTACGPAASGAAGGGASPAAGASAKPGGASTTECLVGTWTSTNQAYNGKSMGGVGQKYAFTSGQKGSLDYTGSGPVATTDGLHSIQYSGSVSWLISKFTSTSATAGTFVFTGTGGSVTAVNDGTTSTVPSNGSGQLAWTCNGNAATLTETVPSTSDHEVWTLKRTSK